MPKPIGSKRKRIRTIRVRLPRTFTKRIHEENRNRQNFASPRRQQGFPCWRRGLASKGIVRKPLTCLAAVKLRSLSCGRIAFLLVILRERLMGRSMFRILVQGAEKPAFGLLCLIDSQQ